jgi:hypothetical protein
MMARGVSCSSWLASCTSDTTTCAAAAVVADAAAAAAVGAEAVTVAAAVTAAVTTAVAAVKAVAAAAIVAIDTHQRQSEPRWRWRRTNSVDNIGAPAAAATTVATSGGCNGGTAHRVCSSVISEHWRRWRPLCKGRRWDAVGCPPDRPLGHMPTRRQSIGSS